ncbi:MAG: prepilin peptidase [Proteobacteria bacterium]|nr:MAG: prepilin peptidase [Pseudomonadota bacterium]
MIIFFILLGLSIGSFLNVVILRMPENKSIAHPSSHCPKCHKSLKWYHNIPFFSWLFLGGKCAYCKGKISIQYPLIEILCSLIFAFCFLKQGHLLSSIIYGTLFSALLALSVIDLRYKAVPDNLSIPTMLLAFFANPPLFTLKYGLLFAGGFALLRMIVSFLIKKEAMGEADIIIAAIIGSVLGLKLGLVAIYISALISLPIFFIVRKKDFELPFIPFLVLGLAISYAFDDQLLELLGKWYG